MAGVAMPAAAQRLPGLVPNEPVPTIDDNDDLAAGGSNVAGLNGYPGRGFQLDASMSSRYEDNLSRRPLRDDGLRLRPTATVSYGLGAGRVGLYATGTYGRDIIIGNSFLREADRQRYGAGVAAQLARCSVDAGGSYARNLILSTDVAAFGALQQRNTQAEARAVCKFGAALQVSGGIGFGDTGLVRGSNTAAFDSERWSYNAGLAFSRPLIGTLSLDGAISDVTFTGRFVVTPTGNVEDGLLQRSVRLGWTRSFGSRLTISAGGSYLDTGPRVDSAQVIIDGIVQPATRSSFSGGGYDAGLLFRPTPRLTLNARASRSIRVNNFVGAQFSVVDTLLLSAQLRVGRNTTLSAGWDKLDARFRSTVVTPLEPLPRLEDRFSRYFATIGTRIGQRLSLALEVSHNRRISNPATFSFESTGVGLNLGFQLGKK